MNQHPQGREIIFGKSVFHVCIRSTAYPSLRCASLEQDFIFFYVQFLCLTVSCSVLPFQIRSAHFHRKAKGEDPNKYTCQYLLKNHTNYVIWHHTDTHTHHTHTHIHMHNHTHTMHVHTHKHTNITHACMHTYHTFMHALTHHTHTHTHMLSHVYTVAFT